jgi:hypothetical protein
VDQVDLQSVKLKLRVGALAMRLEQPWSKPAGIEVLVNCRIASSKPFRFEPVEVDLPVFRLFHAQFVQVIACVKTGIVAVIKNEPYCVVPDSLD